VNEIKRRPAAARLEDRSYIEGTATRVPSDAKKTAKKQKPAKQRDYFRDVESINRRLLTVYAPNYKAKLRTAASKATTSSLQVGKAVGPTTTKKIEKSGQETPSNTAGAADTITYHDPHKIIAALQKFQGRSELLTGCHVRHESFGDGRIADVTFRNGALGLLAVAFGESVKRFNSVGIKNSLLTEVTLPRLKPKAPG
jgi:hypothetical protein